MRWIAEWIESKEEMGEVAPVFVKEFCVENTVEKAVLYVTAMGVYEAELNGTRIGEYVLAPGWTAYEKRLQYQTYDVTSLLQEQNSLQIMVGKGWYGSKMGVCDAERTDRSEEIRVRLLAQLQLTYQNGATDIWGTNESWKVKEGPVRFSQIYDGEHFDATVI